MSTPPSRRRDVTIADVALEAKVSKAQAARALGGYGAVSDEVRSRVIAAAETLKYHPNELARSMNTGKSSTLGVVVGDIENPYFSLAMRGISDAAKASGFNVILINTGENVTAETEAVRVLLDKRVDGMIVAPASSQVTEHLERVVESGRPLVLLDREAPGLGVNAVVAEMNDVAYEALQHLIESGHSRIGFVSTLNAANQPYARGLDLGTNPVARRLKGMQRAFDEAGLPMPVDLIRLSAGKPTPIGQIVRELLEGPDRATAIIASDSLIALHVLAAVRDLGLKIPGDLSFVMFDDLPWTELMNPPITVVSQPVYDIGVAAANTLLAHIANRPATPGSLVLPSTLIKRGSVAAPRTLESRLGK